MLGPGDFDINQSSILGYEPKICDESKYYRYTIYLIKKKTKDLYKLFKKTISFKKFRFIQLIQLLYLMDK